MLLVVHTHTYVHGCTHTKTFTFIVIAQERRDVQCCMDIIKIQAQKDTGQCDHRRRRSNHSPCQSSGKDRKVEGSSWGPNHPAHGEC